MPLKIRLIWTYLFVFTTSLLLICSISSAQDTLVLTTVMGSADVNAGVAKDNPLCFSVYYITTN